MIVSLLTFAKQITKALFLLYFAGSIKMSVVCDFVVSRTVIFFTATRGTTCCRGRKLGFCWLKQ